MTHIHMDNAETIGMLKPMFEESQIGMVCTFPKEQHFPDIESMKTKDIDLQGNIWFIFSSESLSYKNLQLNNEIILIYAIPAQSQFVRIVGTAEINKMTPQIYKYWSTSDEKQFTDGRSDLRIRLLKIKIESSQCLKFESNGMIDVLKLLGRAISNRGTDRLF